MHIEHITENNVDIAVISGQETLIDSPSSALELAMAARHETGADRLAIEKSAIAEDFFILSTGMAGEILQKFINYRIKAAIWGDFSRYTSRPLRDFIYESNQGRDFFFVDTREEALRRLREAV